MKNQHLTIAAENDTITITIGIETLCHAVRIGRPYGQGGVKITDQEAFIQNLIYGMQSEQEDGTTPVHSMFDEAVTTMLENGEEGLEVDEEDQ